MRRAAPTLPILASLALALGLVAPAAAAPTVSATASFNPDRLGASTALRYSFSITDPSGGLPSPLTKVVAMLPAGSTIDPSGLVSCPSLTALENNGPSACPTRSFTGFGTAQVAATLGDQTLNETATLTIFLGPSSPGHTVLDFFGEGDTPIYERLAFTGTEQPASPPYGREFVVNVPAIATVPGGPDASILSLSSTIGATNAAYYVNKRVKVRVGGRTRTVTRRVLQHVKGLTVPSHCPSGGFPFALAFSFEDGSTVTTPVTIPCP
jgi:hypothetical protein